MKQETPKQESFIERMKPLQEQWQQDMYKELMKKETTLEEVLGSSMCQFSVIENKLAILYRNQVKIYDAVTKEQQGYSEEEVIELLQKALTHQDDGETGSLVTAQGEIRPANFFSWFNKFKNK